MRRHIKYKAELSIDGNSVYVQIIEQTHRGESFSPMSRYFQRGGIRLGSSLFPESIRHDILGLLTVYCRGELIDKDNDVITMPIKEYYLFKAAILDYNECFKGDL